MGNIFCPTRQRLIPIDFKSSQGWGLHHCPGLEIPFHEGIVPKIQPQSSLEQLEAPILFLLAWEKIPTPTWIPAPVREFWRVRRSLLIQLRVLSWPGLLEIKFLPAPVGKRGIQGKIPLWWMGKWTPKVSPAPLCSPLRECFPAFQIFLFPSNISCHEFLLRFQPDPSRVSLWDGNPNFCPK